MKRHIGLAFSLVFALSAVAEQAAERIFRAERFSRGDTNYRKLSAIDSAHWLWHPDVKAGKIPARPLFLRFRNDFTLEKDETVELDVSGDERYVLMLDGETISEGPNRGYVENWQFQSYRLTLTAGSHRLEAFLSRLGDPDAPCATRSNGGGFILKASGSLDAELSTGKGVWKVGVLRGTRPDGLGTSDDTFGCGSQFAVRGTGWISEEPATWVDAVSVRDPVPDSHWGVSCDGWALYPSQLPDQIRRRVVPGRARAARRGVSDPLTFWKTADAQESAVAAFDAALRGKGAFVVPARTKIEVLWDLENYYCAFPEFQAHGGKGATIRWDWIESLRIPGLPNHGGKGHRAEFAEKAFFGPFGDTFLPDGRNAAKFSVPWWRCGRWCRITVETADEPVSLSGISIVESHYPLEMEASFESDSRELNEITRICFRGLQMCAHDITMDCPRYEQQMYPGDAFMFFRAMAGCTADDRLLRRAVDIFDFSRRSDGSVPMNSPTRVTQNSTTWTLFWSLMLGDYADRGQNVAWLKTRAIGLRHTLFGLSGYENAAGLLENAPGWSFIDWVPEWHAGTVPDGGTGNGSGVSGILNLLYLNALRSAARVERAIDEPKLADYWEERAGKLRAAIRKEFFVPARGLIADTVRKDSFSVHAQDLALLGGVFEPSEKSAALEAVAHDGSLRQCASYFKHFTFTAAFEQNRPEIFFDGLSMWRQFLADGLLTPIESPTFPRSDCHGFDSFPLWHLQADVAGVRPAAPFYAKVRIAPQPGKLSFIRARTPHPRGFIETDLRFNASGAVFGSVTLPHGITGTFELKGRVLHLHDGKNLIELTD